MKLEFLYDRRTIDLDLPDNAIVYESEYPAPSGTGPAVIREALDRPLGAPTLREAIRGRRPGHVVIAVSDITRPVPYRYMLPLLLDEIEGAGVAREDILILVATGMHRPSTPDEKVEMFGQDIVDGYRIMDHRAEADEDVTELDGTSWSGSRVRVNRHFVSAGFRIATGLVEPHFMAGFSGGRKTVCPGLVSLETIQKFHGYGFLASAMATNAVLDGNPCHEESQSVARLVGVDYCVNVVINRHREVVAAYAGDVEAVHRDACEFVRSCACRSVKHEADVALTSSGGFPLDGTFYQSVKGFVSCLPAVKPGGTVVAFGACVEGIGSMEYEDTMARYGRRWRGYLEMLRGSHTFVKDQWELQMHAKALERVGVEGLHFISSGLTADQLSMLAVTGVSVPPDDIAAAVQAAVDAALSGDKSLAVFPEGPYCVVV